MLAVTSKTASDVRKHFKSTLDEVVQNAETVIIQRVAGGNCVIISEDVYNNLIENDYIRSDQQSYKRLMESVNSVKRGQTTKRELIND